MSMDTFEGVDADWAPTRISTALALGGALVLVAMLLWQVDDVVAPAAAGIVGALCFAGSLWLLDFDGQESLTAVVVSVLTVPVGAGIVLAGLGTTLLLTSSLFPVDDAALISVGALVVLGHVGVVWGVVFAVLGITLGVRNTGDPASVAQYSRFSLLTGIVPAAVGGALVTSTLLFGEGSPLLRPSAIIGNVVSMVLSPDPTTVQFAQFLFLFAVALWTFQAAIRALPVAELLADRGAGETREESVERVLGVLSGAAVVATVALLIAGTIQLGQSTAEIRELLGTGVYDSLQSVAAASGLRVLLVSVSVLSLGTLCLAWGVRRVARSSSETVARQWGPLATGGVVTVIVLSVAEPVYWELIEQFASRMPSPIDAEFRTLSVELADVFGVGSLILMLTALLIATTLVLVLGFRVALFFGYLSTETAGYSLASGGLFVATVFAGTVGTPAWLVFGGIVVSLFVWDAGRFGTTLGTEVGRQTPTRGTELVHAGGTALVGLLGAVAAYAVASGIERIELADASVAVVALLSVVAGILLLVAALR